MAGKDSFYSTSTVKLEVKCQQQEFLVIFQLKCFLDLSAYVSLLW